MNKLLLDESPLVILPELATRIGLNEAIFLQQLHYWLLKSTNEHDGKIWMYNSYEKLQEQFPFWSVKTLRRIVKSLQDLGLILVGNFNKNKWEKTNWYTINYANLGGIIEEDNVSPSREGQNDPTEEDNMTPSYKVKSFDRDYTETTTENKKINKKSFSFNLTKSTSYEALSQEYKSKLRGYAVTKDGAHQIDNFLDNHCAKGSKFKDWSKAYNTWIRNAQSYSNGSYQSNSFVSKHEHPEYGTVFKDCNNNRAYDENFNHVCNVTTKAKPAPVQTNVDTNAVPDFVKGFTDEVRSGS